jgi:hypothetical protein
MLKKFKHTNHAKYYPFVLLCLCYELYDKEEEINSFMWLSAYLRNVKNNEYVKISE